ncbi:MAG: HAD family phosphatase [Actinobacteria bacterium]|nr:HAD family phosphatase [Actinomycetota bacterium]
MTARWRPKLVALDIDGTLVDYDGVLPGSVRTAVRRVVDAGVPVVISTGRSWTATQVIIESLELPPAMHVCSNGAVVVDYPPFEIVRHVTFDPGPVIDRVVAETNAIIAVEEVGRGYRVSAAFPDGELYGRTVHESIESLKSRPVSRVIVRDPEGGDDDFLDLAERLGLHGVSYFVGWKCWLDIAPEGVDKAAGLSVACERYGVAPEDVLALGDGYNDIEMLRWAGRGVALGDAPREVAEAADHVTGSFADGGTAEELSRWF